MLFERIRTTTLNQIQIKPTGDGKGAGWDVLQLLCIFTYYTQISRANNNNNDNIIYKRNGMIVILLLLRIIKESGSRKIRGPFCREKLATVRNNRLCLYGTQVIRVNVYNTSVYIRIAFPAIESYPPASVPIMYIYTPLARDFRLIHICIYIILLYYYKISDNVS